MVDLLFFKFIYLQPQKKYHNNINTKENDESRYRSKNFRKIRS